MKKLLSRNYRKRLAKWLWRGKFYLLTFAAFIITVLYIIGALNWFPNHVSAIMAILGLVILFQQLTADAIQFSEHKPNTFRNWVNSYPNNKPIDLGIANIALSAITIRAHLKTSIREDETIEKKVEFLLRDVSSIHDNIAKMSDQITDLDASQIQIKEEIKSELDKYNNVLNKIVAGHVVGDYDKNFFAVMIAFCGTIIQLFT